MRLHLWFILILAFAVGMGCAMVLRALYFEAEPVVQQTSEPKTKILVAVQTIPSNVEITADFVSFLEVPLSEVPLGALTSFTQVYRRQPAYPIPEGCPICEDLLLPIPEIAAQAAFIPVGSQLVTLDIVHVRQGDRVFPPRKPLSTLLNPDQPVDIRVVPREEARGRLAEMKKEVIRTFSMRDFRSSGELILENASIYEVHSTRDSLTLMLDQEDAAKLNAAAKKGNLRIIARQDSRKTPESTEVQDAVESVEPSEALSVLMPVFIPMEPVVIASVDKVPEAAPMPTDIDDSLLFPAPVPDSARSPVMRAPQSLGRLDRQPEEEKQPDAALPEPDSEEKIPIRNDAPMTLRPIAPPADAPERGFQSHPHTETAMGSPRVSQTIQFLPPGSLPSVRRAYPTRESSSEVARRTGSEFLSPTPPISAKPLETPAMPLAIPTPQVLSDKSGVSGYSPFERRFEQRVFTVFPENDSDESLSDVGIPTPPLLMKGLDTDPPQ